MRTTPIYRLTILFAILGAYGAQAQDHFPANEELRHFRAMSAPRLSPDGHRVLIAIADATADGGRWHLWLSDIEHNSCRQLTFSPPGKKNDKDRGENSGEWMA